MLDIRKLTAGYGKTKILNSVSLTLEKGESIALIGESGTGKTTLARSIIGLGEVNCTGEILFQGINLLETKPGDMAEIRWNKIAMVFQNIEDALNPVYTVLDQITEPMIAHNLLNKNEAKKKAIELLARTGLPQNCYNSYPHQLSGGQKQRVLIAMALANDPELLILDEPTSALDPITKAEIIRLLQEIGRQCTMLIVTHDLSTAARLARRTAVLYGGMILETGQTDHILSSPRHPYTRGLLRSYPNMTTTKDLQGIPGRLSRPEKGCLFEPRCTQSAGICNEKRPQLKEADGRMIACHLGGIVPLLEMRSLSKHFGQVRALERIDLTLYEGETVAVIGESGSGKTTLARTLMGLYDKSEGDIFLEGIEVRKRNSDFYRVMQMIFQNPADSVSHRQNVLEAVKEPLDIHNTGSAEEKIERVRKVLDEVELPSTDEFLHSYPHHLSGGEAQRVAIARALILEPKLLIADEPTSALDPSVQAKILKLLLNLQERRGLSILFITHDIALARKISDRLVVLKEGRMVEQGPSHLVVSFPRHPYTKTLLVSAPSLDTGIRLFEDIELKKCSTA